MKKETFERMFKQYREAIEYEKIFTSCLGTIIDKDSTILFHKPSDLVVSTIRIALEECYNLKFSSGDHEEDWLDYYLYDTSDHVVSMEKPYEKDELGWTPKYGFSGGWVNSKLYKINSPSVLYEFLEDNCKKTDN